MCCPRGLVVAEAAKRSYVVKNDDVYAVPKRVVALAKRGAGSLHGGSATRGGSSGGDHSEDDDDSEDEFLY